MVVREDNREVEPRDIFTAFAYLLQEEPEQHISLHAPQSLYITISADRKLDLPRDFWIADAYADFRAEVPTGEVEVPLRLSTGSQSSADAAQYTAEVPFMRVCCPYNNPILCLGMFPAPPDIILLKWTAIWFPTNLRRTFRDETSSSKLITHQHNAETTSYLAGFCEIGAPHQPILGKVERTLCVNSQTAPPTFRELNVSAK